MQTDIHKNNDITITTLISGRLKVFEFSDESEYRSDIERNIDSKQTVRFRQSLIPVYIVSSYISVQTSRQFR